MQVRKYQFRAPSNLTNAEGEIRTVGFELEFTGLTLDEAVSTVKSAYGANSVSGDAAQQKLDVATIGEFTIEIDWNFLKKLASEQKEFQEQISMISDAASLLVPVEVVCPPVKITEMTVLDVLIDALRKAGAEGTKNSALAAYGVHVNAEIPEKSATILDAYLKAFCLLQWWMVDRHVVNFTRRVTPYIDLYSEQYLLRVIESRNPTMEQIFNDYLDANSNRNRGLDMLPLLSEIDPDRVKKRVDDPRIKPRPTFHFRLPDCLIDEEGWSLADWW